MRMVPTFSRELARMRSQELAARAAGRARARRSGQGRPSPGRLRAALGEGLVLLGARLLGDPEREGV
jgi:hypothetical protein